jgi:hypothetical protein
MTLIPAYGRDYKSAADVTAAFLAGKDFKVCSFDAGGTYANLADCQTMGLRTVTLRYGKLRRVCVVQVPPEGAQ